MVMSLDEFYEGLKECRDDLLHTEKLYYNYRDYEHYSFLKVYEHFLRTSSFHIQDAIKRYNIKKGKRSEGTLFLLIVWGEGEDKAKLKKWNPARLSKFAKGLTYCHKCKFTLKSIKNILKNKTLNTLLREATQKGPVKDIPIYDMIKDYKEICQEKKAILTYNPNDGITPIMVLPDSAVEDLVKLGYIKKKG